jgi:hypothetical protein
MSGKSLEDASREKVVTSEGVSPYTTDNLIIGCLQRIAKATEAMSDNYQKLIDERNNLVRWRKQDIESMERMDRVIRGLRGHITRLRKSKRWK